MIVTNGEIDRDLQNVNRRFPPYTSVEFGEVQALIDEHTSAWKADGMPVLYSIVQLLNFYETMCGAILGNRFDEKPCRDQVGDQLYSHVNKFHAILHEIRRQQDSTTRPYDFIAIYMLKWFSFDIDSAKPDGQLPSYRLSSQSDAP